MTGPPGRHGWKVGQGWPGPSPGGAPWSSVAAVSGAWGGCRPRASGVSPGQETAPTHFHSEPGGPREATPCLWPVGWSGLSGAQGSVGTGMDAALRAGGGGRLSHSAALCLGRSESPRSIWTTPSAPAGQPGRTIKLSADLGPGAGRQGRGAGGGGFGRALKDVSIRGPPAQAEVALRHSTGQRLTVQQHPPRWPLDSAPGGLAIRQRSPRTLGAQGGG